MNFKNIVIVGFCISLVVIIVTIYFMFFRKKNEKKDLNNYYYSIEYRIDFVITLPDFKKKGVTNTLFKIQIKELLEELIEKSSISKNNLHFYFILPLHNNANNVLWKNVFGKSFKMDSNNFKFITTKHYKNKNLEKLKLLEEINLIYHGREFNRFLFYIDFSKKKFNEKIIFKNNYDWEIFKFFQKNEGQQINDFLFFHTFGFKKLETGKKMFYKKEFKNISNYLKKNHTVPSFDFFVCNTFRLKNLLLFFKKITQNIDFKKVKNKNNLLNDNSIFLYFLYIFGYDFHHEESLIFFYLKKKFVIFSKKYKKNINFFTPTKKKFNKNIILIDKYIQNHFNSKRTIHSFIKKFFY